MKRLFAIVFLVALLGVGGSAHAGVLAAHSGGHGAYSSSTEEEEFERELEEWLEEEIESGELEEPEGEPEEVAEEIEAEEAGDGSGEGKEPAAEEDEEDEEEELEECVLDFADATVVVDSRSDTLRITVHYRSEEPVGIAIGLRSRGSQGAFSLSADKTRFRRAGVFHRSEHLSPSQTAKLMKARSLDLELEPLGFEEACEGLFDEALTARHGSGAKRSFS